MEEPPVPSRRRGRPRSQQAHRALLEAALHEFVTRGYQAMSMEAIAAAASVSKITLYRRWGSKLALVREVLQSLSAATPMEDQGSLEKDLRVLLRDALTTSTTTPAGQIFPRLVGEITGNPDLLELYQTVILRPRLEHLKAMIARARARGELRADLPTAIAAAMIAGPLFYHMTVLAPLEPDMPPDVVEHLTQAILRGIAENET